MSLFNRNRRAKSGAQSGAQSPSSGQKFPERELVDGVSNVLKLLGKTATLAHNDASFRGALGRLERSVRKAHGPDDWEEVALDLSALRVPLDLGTMESNTHALKGVLRHCIEHVIPVAQALAMPPTEASLGQLLSDLDSPEGIDLGRRKLAIATALMADTASFTRRATGVLRLSVAQLIQILGPLAETEPQTQKRLLTIRERLVTAAQVEELERLRGLLLDETEALVRETRSRTEQMARARQQIEEAAAQVKGLENALQDANQMATTDPLTSLGNRRALQNDLAHVGGDGKPTGIVALDVDHFKRVNDNHGHDVGDAALRHIALLTSAELRGKDRAYRVGGEEFLLVLDNADADGATATAERIRLRIASNPLAHSQVPGGALSLTVSMGATQWRTGEVFADASKRADKALYAAKQAGRDRVVRS